MNEGTIYPILKRLTNEDFFETYLVESKEGQKRKYYQIKEKRKKRQQEVLAEWKKFSESIQRFMNERENK